VKKEIEEENERERIKKNDRERFKGKEKLCIGMQYRYWQRETNRWV